MTGYRGGFQTTSSHRSRLCVTAILVAAAVLASWGVVAGAAAAIPSPAWTIHSLAGPAHFVPGDNTRDYFYEVTAVNSGGADTNGGPVTITDTLPVGLTVKSLRLGVRRPIDGAAVSGGVDIAPTACKASKAGEVETVRCVVPEEFPGTETPSLLIPSEQLRLVIHVFTPASASGALVNHAQVQGGGAPSASTTSENKADASPASAGVSAFRAELTGIDGQPVIQAASDPYQYTTSFAVNTAPGPAGGAPLVPAGGNVKNVRVALPPGLVGNPNVASRCTAQQFATQHTVQTPDVGVQTVNDCPDGSAVGIIVVQQVEGNGVQLPLPIYNLVPPKGMPAQFGFQLLDASIFIDTELRTGGDYGIDAFVRNSSEVKRFTAARVTLWGTPTDPSHDRLRGGCVNQNAENGSGYSLGSCAAGLPLEPFFRLPTSCGSPLLTRMSIDTWTVPGVFHSADSLESPLVNCAVLDFSPTIKAQPHTTVADSPSGLRFNLHLPQNGDPKLLAEADLRDAVVTLPRGVTVNPASANDLVGCSPAQVDLNGPGAAQCPDASKVGSVEIQTPLLDHPVKGGVYVATQGQNPFGSLLAIYIALEDKQSGVVVKLAGHVVPDPATGQLTTRFLDNPQLPFEDFTVEFFDGPRAPLRTPSTCGAYATETSLKPWSAPQSGPDAAPSDSFSVARAPGGGPCAPNESSLPHRPAFSAGTTAPVAAAFSPFVTQLKREDGSQTLRGLRVTLPEGMLAKLAGVPYCPEPSIARAATRSGNEELATPACPDSRVGTVIVGAGAGSSPVYVKGTAYLAGPYKGAPLSLAVVTPAVAGPFDLGTVVVRAALRIDQRTTEVAVDSDPIPTILQGIPLDVRSIAVDVDRPRFTLNPTDCQPKSVGAQAISLLGQGVALSDRFQVGGCRGLDFSPRLGLRLFGGTKRADNPRLRAVLRPKEGEANIARTTVALPHSIFLDQAHIRTICTRVQFAADQCPAGSIYGFAVAETPLLDEPLMGPVYLRSSDNPLPDLVVALRGQVDVDLVGRIDSVRGGIRTSFDFVPDAPVSKFVLRMKGGKEGLLVNSTDLCGAKHRATVKMDGQNGRAHDFKPLLRSDCGKAKNRRPS